MVSGKKRREKTGKDKVMGQRAKEGIEEQRGTALAGRGDKGFSLVELLVSITIIIILMGLLFEFLNLNQKQYRSQQLLSEVTEGGRSAFEIMAQELDQAGYNPPFTNSRDLSSTSTTYGPGLTLLPLSWPSTCGSCSGSTSNRIFYGSTLVIGNSCGATGATCDQETVTVTGNSTDYLNTGSVPVVLANTHNAGEPVFDRNFPYPTGILYDNRVAGANAVADNKVQFFGDVMGDGYLYYGEYRLQQGFNCTAGKPTWTGACPASPPCSTPLTTPDGKYDLFRLTRFLTKLYNTGVFSIPSDVGALGQYDGATVSPIVSNIVGTCATGSGTWNEILPDETSSTRQTTVYAAANSWSGNSAQGWADPVINPDGTTPDIWYKMQTYGACDASTSPCTPDFESFVTNVEITLTIQESTRDPVTGKQSQQILETRIVPKNIVDAMSVAQNGAAAYLPQTPVDLNNPPACTPGTSCYTLPMGCTYAGGLLASTQTCP